MKRGGPEHPKMLSLADKLDISQSWAVGLLECLWHFAAKYAPRGNVGKYSDRIIARNVFWPEDRAEELCAALVEEAWLENDSEHRLVIHDWTEHADDSVHRQLARQGEYFADGTKPRLTRLSGEERKRIENRYLDDVRPTCAQRAHEMRPALADTEALADTNADTEDLTEGLRVKSNGRAKVPVSVGKIRPDFGALSPNDLVRRIIAVTGEAGWREWWAETITRYESAGGGLVHVAQAVQYVEDCASPETRRAKALGPLDKPGAYLTRKMTDLCKAQRVRWPEFPKHERAKA